MAIRMSREEMIEDLKLTWTGIMRLDPEAQININDAESSWQRLDDQRLEHTYNGARAVLWRMIREQNNEIG
jgi:hypothetical protein